MDIYNFYVLFAITQLIHSQEEIWTGFHKKWFVFTMPRWLFIMFEVALSAVIILYLVNPQFYAADVFMKWFMFVMLLNGMEHVIWAAVKRAYMPGLVTAPIFILLFILYYARLT